MNVVSHGRISGNNRTPARTLFAGLIVHSHHIQLRHHAVARFYNSETLRSVESYCGRPTALTLAILNSDSLAMTADGILSAVRSSASQNSECWAALIVRQKRSPP